MPANLTPDFHRAEEEYKRATTPQERVDGLKKMLANIPKHKGTDKMQADLKKRLAQAREDIQKAGKKKGFSVKVEREGGAQVTVVGPPNCGKSLLVSALSGLSLEVAAYPYTTLSPHPAMMPYQDIKIQLVDLPPVCSQHMEFWVPNIIRVSDFIILIIDIASDNVLDDVKDVLNMLEKNKVKLVHYFPKENYWASVIEKKAILVGNKADKKNAPDNWNLLQELFADQFKKIAVSAASGSGINQLKELLIKELDIIRVYSKRLGKEADFTDPFVLKRGSIVSTFAQLVHKDFAEKLKFARIWGHGKFEGQRVNKDYVLQDKDIVELHI